MFNIEDLELTSPIIKAITEQMILNTTGKERNHTILIKKMLDICILENKINELITEPSNDIYTDDFTIDVATELGEVIKIYENIIKLYE